MHSPNLLKSVLKSQAIASSALKDSSNTHMHTKHPSAAASPPAEVPLFAGSKSSMGIPSSPSKKAPARSCLCAPTSHPGSFRCRLHRAKAVALQSGSHPGSRVMISKQSNVARKAPIVCSPPLPPPPVPASRGASSRIGVSRLSKVSSATSDRQSFLEDHEEGPFRFLKSAAAAVGTGATVWKKGYDADDSLRKLGSDASPAAAAKGLSSGGDRVYEVQSGDSLSSIARSMGTTIEVLREANALKSTTLQPGQTIWVPKTHTIQKGDTLSKIAKEYSTTVDDILKMNSVENPDQIFPGDVLLLP